MPNPQFDLKSDGMLCPLVGVLTPCAYDRCAWWVERTDRRYSECAIRLIARRANDASYYARKALDRD